MAAGRLLITGASGFVGRWTLRHWRSVRPDTDVWAVSDRPRPPEVPSERYAQLDLRDRQAVREFVLACSPAQVIHLAALISGATLADYLAVNVVGTENLYLALAEVASPPAVRIVQAGSAAIYGKIRPQDLPVREEQALRPLTDYALSKAAQDQLAYAMGRRHGLQIMRARIFNMVGPGQPDTLVPMTFVKQMREVGGGRADRLKVGNTAARRDFVDVRDVVGAFDALLQKGRPGEVYNVASGKGTAIQEILDGLFRLSGIEVEVEVASERLRPQDVPCIRADVSKIARDTGWNPGIPLQRSLEDVWRDVCAHESGDRV